MISSKEDWHHALNEMLLIRKVLTAHHDGLSLAARQNDLQLYKMIAEMSEYFDVLDVVSCLKHKIKARKHEARKLRRRKVVDESLVEHHYACADEMSELISPFMLVIYAHAVSYADGVLVAEIISAPKYDLLCRAEELADAIEREGQYGWLNGARPRLSEKPL